MPMLRRPVPDDVTGESRDRLIHSCLCKVQYPSEKAANAARRRTWGQEFIKHGAEGIGGERPLGVYLCLFCHCWHVGHVPKEMDKCGHVPKEM